MGSQPFHFRVFGVSRLIIFASLREPFRLAFTRLVVCITKYNTNILLAFFSGLDDTSPMVAMPSTFGSWNCQLPSVWLSALRVRLHYRSTEALPPDHCGSGLIPWSVVRSQRSRRLTFRPLRVFASLRESFPIFAFRFALGALVPWRLISVFRSALRFLRATLPLYHPSKNESGKEKVILLH